MEDESPRRGNANVRLCYDIARQESASNMSVERDYYQASDFIVKRFLLISYLVPTLAVSSLGSRCNVFRCNCALLNDVSLDCNLFHVTARPGFICVYSMEFQPPTNEALKMAFIRLAFKQVA